MLNSIRYFIIRLRNDDRGLTAVEYAVLGGIIVGGLSTIGLAFRAELTTAFENLIPGTPPA